MNSDARRNSENDNATPTCFGKSRECVVHSFVLAFSTLIFVISMILAAYMTYKASMDKIVVVLILSSSLLYILGFTSNMYHIYCSKPNNGTSRSDGNSNGLNQATGISSQNSSTSGRPPDILRFPHATQPIRNTPPPPYEIQMSEMSRLSLPGTGTSRTNHLSTRESEVAEEVRKFIIKMYEEFRRADEQVAQSPRNDRPLQQRAQSPRNERSVQQIEQSPRKERSVQQVAQSPRKERSVQQVAQSPRNELSLQQMAQSPRNERSSQQMAPLPRNERSVQQVAKSPRNERSAQLRAQSPRNERSVQQVAQSPKNERSLKQVTQTHRNERSLQQIVQTPEIPARQQKRMLPKVYHPNLTAVKSVPVHGFTPSDFRTNQATRKIAATNSLPIQLDLQRLIIGSEGRTVAPPQPSPRREDFLQGARKRNLTSQSKELQTWPKSTGKTPHGVVVDNDTQNNIYEPTETVKSIPSANSSQAVYDPVKYYCLESEFEDSSEQASSVCSAASEPGTADRNPSVNVHRQLSEASSRMFRQLGQSPSTFLDAIAKGFDLTPNEWMVAWKLGLKGVSLIERARILGVRLHESSSNDDN